jgi:hypothetical protein
MTRKITLAAVATAAAVVLGACSKSDSYNDTGLGSTTGAMATPPAAYPPAGTTGNTTGVLAPSDSGDSAKWSNADSIRHKATKTTSKKPY